MGEVLCRRCKTTRLHRRSTRMEVDGYGNVVATGHRYPDLCRKCEIANGGDLNDGRTCEDCGKALYRYRDTQNRLVYPPSGRCAPCGHKAARARTRREIREHKSRVHQQFREALSGR